MSTGFAALAVVLATVCLQPSVALAEQDGQPEWGPEMVGYLFLGAADLALGVSGGVFAVGNWSTVALERPTTDGWRIGGYVTGGLNLAASIAWLTFGLLHDDRPKELFIMAGAHAVIGGLDLAFTIWSADEPDTAGTSIKNVSIGPVLMSDVRGNPVCGAGLRVANW